MFVRNCLQPSDFVTLVPVGIPTTLRYDDKGIIDRVYWGMEETCRQDITDMMLSCVDPTDEIKPFPLSISLRGGSTWISGVLFTESDYSNSYGLLPQCTKDESLEMFTHNPSEFHFFAAHATSTVSEFKGAVATRRWLDMSGLDVLPGFLCPANLTQDSFDSCVRGCQFTLKYPRICSYVIFRGANIVYVDTNIEQRLVMSVSRRVDESGHICCDLNLKGADTLQVSLADVVYWNIQKNTMIVVDPDGKIIDAYVTDNKKRERRSATTSCEFCGTVFTCPESGTVICSNSDCMSTQYSDCCHLLTELGLPALTFERYAKLCKSRELSHIDDVLLLPEYEACDIHTTLGGILRAAIPDSCLPDSDVIYAFVNSCNNSLQSVEFYLNHPDRISSNLGLRNSNYIRLVGWLAESRNVQLAERLLHSSRINVEAVDKKFEGVPMLRDRTVMITGKFAHGDHQEIASILRSYSATVVTDFSDRVQCLIIGDCNENTNGWAVGKCQRGHIPVFTESQFFDRYQIDDDLRQNLL